MCHTRPYIIYLPFCFYKGLFLCALLLIPATKNHQYTSGHTLSALPSPSITTKHILLLSLSFPLYDNYFIHPCLAQKVFSYWATGGSSRWQAKHRPQPSSTSSINQPPTFTHLHICTHDRSVWALQYPGVNACMHVVVWASYLLYVCMPEGSLCGVPLKLLKSKIDLQTRSFEKQYPKEERGR